MDVIVGSVNLIVIHSHILAPMIWIRLVCVCVGEVIGNDIYVWSVVLVVPIDIKYVRIR